MDIKSTEKIPENRVIVYIDGLNLYEGLCEKGWKKYLWLNIESFAESIILENQHLECVKYFTSRVSYPYEKQLRQTSFIDAISTLKKVNQYFGKFKPDTKLCDRCGAVIHFKTEKQTDVNIATEMLVDAIQNRYTTATLVSGDSDLVPSIKHIKNLYPDKNVLCAFPPLRESYELENASNGAYRIVKKKFRDNQFSSTIINSGGLKITKPSSWS